MIDELTDIWSAQRTESEERLVAGITAEPERLAEVSQVVDSTDFVNPFFGAWYRLALELYEAGRFSVDRLRTQLRKAGYLSDVAEMGEFSRIVREFASGADSLWHASELARIATAKKLKRELQVALESIDHIAVDPDAIARSLSARMESLAMKQAELWEPVGTVANRVYEAHQAHHDDQKQLGTPTGFPSIDRITGGFFPGQLWHIAARSYMGKSTVALVFAQHQMDAGRGVYFASYEMENDELLERMFADRTGTPLSKFTQGGIQGVELSRVKSAAAGLQMRPMFMDDKPPGTVQALKARVKLAMNNTPITLVVIDHLLLFPHQDRRTPRHQQLVEITRDMKAMAKELGVTVLLLNQLNADADGEKPTDKHYAESKGILANLDVSMLLHRESKTSEEMDCNITKNRKGPPDSCQLIFEGEIQRVTDPGNNWAP